MKILITGGAGFIGSTLAKQLHLMTHDVTIIDNFNDTLYNSRIKRARCQKFQASDVKIIEGDINDLNRVDFFRKFDLIFNEAGLPGQFLSWNNLEKYLEANTLGVAKILDSIKHTDTKLIQASTSSVYGRNVFGKEDQQLNPCSPYGVTKTAAENLISAYSQNFKINHKILRYFSVYGPSQRPDMAIQKFLLSIFKNEIITITGDGSQQRDLTFVSDIVDGTISAAFSESEHKILNLSGGKLYSINEIVAACMVVTGKKVKIQYKERPVGDQEVTSGNHNLASEELNYKPKVSLHDGVEQQYRWILENQDFLF